MCMGFENSGVYNPYYQTYITGGKSEDYETHHTRNGKDYFSEENLYDSYEVHDWFEPEPPTDEEIEKYYEEEHKKKQNIRRDRKGRLEKGSMIAKKRSCDEQSIISLYKSGYAVKEIVEFRGCSKSTVYNVIKKYKEKEKK